MSKQEPSPEVKEVMREWVKHNEKKYGKNWKEIVAKELAERATPVMKAFLDAKRKNTK